MTREEYKDKKSRDFRNYREACGIKDPIFLDEIEEAYYQGMTDADSNPHWISVQERLPEEFVDVWAIRDDGNGSYFNMGIYRYIGNGEWEAAPRYIACVPDVVLWHQLPDKPKKGGDR